jgi:hypothetical protein
MPKLVASILDTITPSEIELILNLRRCDDIQREILTGIAHSLCEQETARINSELAASEQKPKLSLVTSIKGGNHA